MAYADLSPYEKYLATFGDSAGIIAALEISNKITPEQAHQRIKELYKELKNLRKKEKDSWRIPLQESKTKNKMKEAPMNQKTKNKIKAIDLLLLDLKTIHPDIRLEAKEHECETELNECKKYLINYLTLMRNNLNHTLIDL